MYFCTMGMRKKTSVVLLFCWSLFLLPTMGQAMVTQMHAESRAQTHHQMPCCAETPQQDKADGECGHQQQNDCPQTCHCMMTSSVVEFLSYAYSPLIFYSHKNHFFYPVKPLPTGFQFFWRPPKIN